MATEESPFESSADVDIPISYVRAMNAPTQQLEFSGSQTSVPAPPRGAPAAPPAPTSAVPTPATGFVGTVNVRNKIGRCAGIDSDSVHRPNCPNDLGTHFFAKDPIGRRYTVEMHSMEDLSAYSQHCHDTGHGTRAICPECLPQRRPRNRNSRSGNKSKPHSGSKRKRVEADDTDVEEDTSGVEPTPLRRAVGAPPASDAAVPPFSLDEFISATAVAAPRASATRAQAPQVPSPGNLSGSPVTDKAPPRSPAQATTAALAAPAAAVTASATKSGGPPPPSAIMLPFPPMSGPDYYWVVKVRSLLSALKDSAEWTALRTHMWAMIWETEGLNEKFTAWVSEHQGAETIPLMSLIRFAHAHKVWDHMKLSAQQTALLSTLSDTLMNGILAPGSASLVPP